MGGPSSGTINCAFGRSAAEDAGALTVRINLSPVPQMADVKASQLYLAWLDQARLVAIAGVVAIHVASPLLSNLDPHHPGRWWVANAVFAVTRWTVPVFVMISGALALQPRSAGTLSYYRRRIPRISVPLIAWSILYWAFLVVIQRQALDPIWLLRSMLAATTYGHLYFLAILLGLALVSPVLAAFWRVADRRERLAVAALALCMGLAFRLFQELRDRQRRSHRLVAAVRRLLPRGCPDPRHATFAGAPHWWSHGLCSERNSHWYERLAGADLREPALAWPHLLVPGTARDRECRERIRRGIQPWSRPGTSAPASIIGDARHGRVSRQPDVGRSHGNCNRGSPNYGHRNGICRAWHAGRPRRIGADRSLRRTSTAASTDLRLAGARRPETARCSMAPIRHATETRSASITRLCASWLSEDDEGRLIAAAKARSAAAPPSRAASE